MRFFTLVGRALRLRCPLCGQGKLFRDWFRMHEQCPHCHVSLEREPGFYLGSIYINYGITCVIALAAAFVLRFRYDIPQTSLLFGALAFTLLFPLLVFPWARSLWLGFDQWRDPREGERGTR
jgi:uncharacterized protein (DUF983 family)